MMKKKVNWTQFNDDNDVYIPYKGRNYFDYRDNDKVIEDDDWC